MNFCGCYAGEDAAEAADSPANAETAEADLWRSGAACKIC